MTLFGEFAPDHAFTIGWFGLMTMVWLGWAQEDPPGPWRWRLGVGSALGLVLAGVFGYAVAHRWGDGSALDGRFHWFGLLVLAEVVAAGVGCFVLWRRGQGRWMAWWVAVVVGAHFVPLAFLLDDWALLVLALVQLAVLAALVPRLKAGAGTTSRLVGPVMGMTFLAFALVSVPVFLDRAGAPW